MNILKRELRAGRKPFIFWSIGLFFIMFAGLAKYTGFQGDENITVLFESFPRIVLAVFGMVDIDISSLGGFYAILAFYGMICTTIYGVSLGCNAVNREKIDKTYEFIFTKPRSRTYILSAKVISAVIYLTLYCILSFLFSIAATLAMNIENTIVQPMILFTIAMWILGILFCSLSIFLTSLINNVEKAALYSNLAFVFAFILGMIYDMLEKGEVLRLISPLKYFLPGELLDGTLHMGYTVLCLILSLLLGVLGMKLFEKKE